jgi:uncharacterized protein YceK
MIIRHTLVTGAVLAMAVALSGCSAVLTATQGTFEGQRASASDAAAKADIMSAKLALLTALVDTGSLPTSVSSLADYGYSPSEGVTNLSFVASGASFCVVATSASGATFHATDAESVSEGACT